MPRGKGRRNQPQPQLQPQANNPLSDYFEDRGGFQYDSSNPAWDEFHRLSRYLRWIDSEKKSEREAFKNVLVQAFNSIYGTDGQDLESWMTLCNVLRIVPPSNDLQGCRKAVKSAYVNLVDLVDFPNTGDPVKRFATEEQLSGYTKATGKFFPRDDAKAGGLLKHLLRNIMSPRVSRRRR
ncbi:hypothetical protein H0H93_014834 [Arthromyces matolae]|nr:hypothetical protein H0H93_014834 [Arthromyces matolae]